MNGSKTVHEDHLLEILTQLFRDRGYDGTSLSRIMEATGLVKASLYHRFSGGKEEMARAVLKRVSETFANNLLAPLGEPGDPADRLTEVASRLRQFYGFGGHPCLLDALTLNPGNRELKQDARSTLQFWLDAFTNFARECGLPPALARQRAEDAVAAIEGGLILARVSGNHQTFLRALQSLPDRLMSGAGAA